MCFGWNNIFIFLHYNQNKKKKVRNNNKKFQMDEKNDIGDENPESRNIINSSLIAEKTNSKLSEKGDNSSLITEKKNSIMSDKGDTTSDRKKKSSREKEEDEIKKTNKPLEQKKTYNNVGQRLKLLVKDYKFYDEKSKIKKGDIIRFFDDVFTINEEEEKHDGSILFGRSLVSREDCSISRKQFKIIIKDKIPFIVCLITPPKLPTSFVITEEAFILEEGQVYKYVFYNLNIS